MYYHFRNINLYIKSKFLWNKHVMKRNLFCRLQFQDIRFLSVLWRCVFWYSNTNLLMISKFNFAKLLPCTFICRSVHIFEKLLDKFWRHDSLYLQVDVSHQIFKSLLVTQSAKVEMISLWHYSSAMHKNIRVWSKDKNRLEMLQNNLFDIDSTLVTHW